MKKNYKETKTALIKKKKKRDEDRAIALEQRKK